MSNSRDKEVISERLEGLVDSSTSSKPLLGKDDTSKTVMQETVVDKNDRRMKFSISLSSKEIEEDLYAMTGRKPTKPMKRSNIMQKKLDALFPKEVQLNFPMPISKDKKVKSERLEEHVDSSTSSKPLLRKDDASKTVIQGSVTDKNERPKEFSVSLSSKEIEEDIYAITGRKPILNPKKRPKVLQKQLDALFPGSRLSEITKDKYKVAE